MTDRPIIFAPMVRALLEGRKTQTRRVLKNVPPMPDPACSPHNEPRHPAPYLDAYCGVKRTAENPRGMSADWCWWQIDDRPGPTFRLGYAPGDRLWVREAWAAGACAGDMPPSHLAPRFWRVENGGLWYRAGGEPAHPITPRGKWRFPIHMPRWASRLTLTVTDVRVQRLQEISKEDAIAEGIDRLMGAKGWVDYGDKPGAMTRRYLSDPRRSFASLWNSIHGPATWDANPWVAAITFTVRQGNIDHG